MGLTYFFQQSVIGERISSVLVTATVGLLRKTGFIMPPTSKKWRGHIGLGLSVRGASL